MTAERIYYYNVPSKIYFYAYSEYKHTGFVFEMLVLLNKH